MSKTLPLPEIERCPFCRRRCIDHCGRLVDWSEESNGLSMLYHVQCACGYESRDYKTERGAINGHNRVARAAKKGA